MNVIIVQHLITQFALEVFKVSKQCPRQADQPINQLSNLTEISIYIHTSLLL